MWSWGKRCFSIHSTTAVRGGGFIELGARLRYRFKCAGEADLPHDF
jgi:hypothetical protein